MLYWRASCLNQVAATTWLLWGSELGGAEPIKNNTNPDAVESTANKTERKTMEIIRGMSEQHYRARPEISQSIYKAFRKPTAKHAVFELGVTKDATDNMVMGTCLHALILEGKTIYAVMPDADGRTKEGKLIRAQFSAQNEGKIIISPAHAARVEGMAAGIMDCEGAVAILKAEGETELSIFWNGMKARLDKSFAFGVCDLKTTSDASDRGFSASIETFGYAIQFAHYLEAAAVAGLPCEDAYIIAVENVAPFVAGVIKIPHQSIDIGRMELIDLKAKYENYKNSGIANGYPEREIGLPNWKIREFYKENE